MLKSQLVILQQAKSYLTSVTDQQYTQIIEPYFMSSAGAHMRHILDHYYALINGYSKGLIDYDKRSRGGDVEKSAQAALSAIDDIILFLKTLSDQQLQQTIKLSTEVSVKDKVVVIVDTTLAREVIFTGSHTVHHLATIKQIAQHQNIKLENGLGLAPATATFLRKTAN